MNLCKDISAAGGKNFHVFTDASLNLIEGSGIDGSLGRDTAAPEDKIFPKLAF